MLSVMCCPAYLPICTCANGCSESPDGFTRLKRTLKPEKGPENALVKTKTYLSGRSATDERYFDLRQMAIAVSMSQCFRGKDLCSKLSNGSNEFGLTPSSASNSEVKFSRRALHSSCPPTRSMTLDPAARRSSS